MIYNKGSQKSENRFSDITTTLKNFTQKKKKNKKKTSQQKKKKKKPFLKTAISLPYIS
jgi:hypothetical protein